MSLFPFPALDHYLAMWNETDRSAIRPHLDQAVTEGFVFCDPLHDHVGRDALEANVQEFRTTYPHAVLSVASVVDHHHNRGRYEWHIMLKGRVMIVGFDSIRVADSGLLDRVDGFFGPLAPAIIAE